MNVNGCSGFTSLFLLKFYNQVFVYYADHGGPGILGMPQGEKYLYGEN